MAGIVLKKRDIEKAVFQLVADRRPEWAGRAARVRFDMDGGDITAIVRVWDEMWENPQPESETDDEPPNHPG